MEDHNNGYQIPENSYAAPNGWQQNPQNPQNPQGPQIPQNGSAENGWRPSVRYQLVYQTRVWPVVLESISAPKGRDFFNW